MYIFYTVCVLTRVCGRVGPLPGTVFSGSTCKKQKYVFILIRLGRGIVEDVGWIRRRETTRVLKKAYEKFYEIFAGTRRPTDLRTHVK